MDTHAAQIGYKLAPNVNQKTITSDKSDATSLKTTNLASEALYVLVESKSVTDFHKSLL